MKLESTECETWDLSFVCDESDWDIWAANDSSIFDVTLLSVSILMEILTFFPLVLHSVSELRFLRIGSIWLGFVSELIEDVLTPRDAWDLDDWLEFGWKWKLSPDVLEWVKSLGEVKEVLLLIEEKDDGVLGTVEEEEFVSNEKTGDWDEEFVGWEKELFEVVSWGVEVDVDCVEQKGAGVSFELVSVELYQDKLELDELDDEV